MKSNSSNKTKQIATNVILYAALLIFIIFFSIMRPKFFSFKNLKSVLQSLSSLAVLGMGVSFILVIGEIDISLGAMMSLVPCACAVLMEKGVHVVPALLLPIVLVLLLGLLNGYLVGKIQLTSFIATFGVQGIAMGFTRIITGNKSVKMPFKGLVELFGGKTAGIPNGFFWMVGMVLIGWFILKHTAFGRKLHCIGDNSEAARLFGINVEYNKILAFLVSSIFALVAGLIESMRASYMQAGTGESLMMYAIVVCLIGGTLITGGKTNPLGTVVGAFFVIIIENGLFLISISAYMQEIVVGIIILIVLSFNAVLENRNLEMNRK